MAFFGGIGGGVARGRALNDIPSIAAQGPAYLLASVAL